MTLLAEPFNLHRSLALGEPMNESNEDEIAEMDFDDILGDPPKFDAALTEECREAKDFRPLYFEWYKFVAMKCSLLSTIDLSTDCLKPIPEVHRAVFVGLLSRCARLMCSNLKLSEENSYGETTRIIDRCIAESAVKIRWLCHKDSRESFVRYLANALKKDFDLQDTIWRNVADRAGDGVVIEKRMLGSIALTLEKSGLTEMEVIDAKQLPDLATMFGDLGLKDDLYTALQRMGSHSVHGTWTDLVANYLDRIDGRFYPQDHGIATQDVQYIVICRLVLWAMADYLHYVITDCSLLKVFVAQVQSIEKILLDFNDLVRGPDWEPEQL